MSCLNITPLVLSDTFSTWFDRTNQCIEGINSFSMRGLSATNLSGNDISGFVIKEENDCFYSINLRTGPFLGFITDSEDGYSAGIHGTGDYENPYNITLKFSGSEEILDRSQVATGDYLIVSDSDDFNKVKKTTANAFLTRLNGGSKIVVNEDESSGEWTISFVPLFFSPTFSNSTTFTEIGFTFSSINFTIGSPTDPLAIPPKVSTITTTSTNIDNWSNLTLSGTGTTTSSGIQLPDNVDWFGFGSGKSTSIKFTATITSDNVSTNGTNFTPEVVTRDTFASFAWRFSGFSSPNELTIQEIAEGITQSGFPSLNMQVAQQTASVPSGPGGGGGLVNNPNTKRTLTFPTAGYNYFFHTCHPSYDGNNSDDFGFNPTFYDLLGPVSEGWATEIGTMDVEFNINSRKAMRRYRVYRSTNQYNAGNTIQVGQ